MRLVSFVVSSMLMLAATAVSADCHFQHKAYKLGEAACEIKFELICSENGAWRRTTKHCVPPPEPPAANPEPAVAPTQSNPSPPHG